MDKFIKLVKVSPLIGAFLIFNGYLKLYYFYEHWHINISDYLNSTEIILSFLNDFNIILCFLILLVIEKGIGFLMADTESSNTLIEALDNPVVKCIIILVELIVAIIFFVQFLHYSRIITLYISVTSFASFLFTLLSLKFDDVPSLTVSTFVGILFFSYCLSINDINEVNVKKYLTQTILLTKKDTITTTSTLYLIGKTKDYVFLFDSKENTSKVFKTKNIAEIQTRYLR